MCACANLLRVEKALGGSGTRALIKAQMEKERREVAAADAGSVVGKLAKNKAAAKRIAKCVSRTHTHTQSRT